ncbi:MAG TPA: hypothetical protein VHE61_01950 [Opitutaceae bacterium]|nr:hypothetical protein [Opitutaceae bacterium]
MFGTCLIRAVGRPSGLYRAIGRELAARTGVGDQAEFAEDFIEWRNEAERRAREQSLREEVRLDDIWRELVAMLGANRFGAVDGPALEMEIERSTLRPIEPTRVRIDQERAAGRRILFISDTALPAPFLTGLLCEHGFAVPGDPVYVSSDSGYTKRKGSLFRHVLDSRKLDPRELRHIGDDPVADVESPGRLGIVTEWFTATRPKTIERLLLWRRPSAERPWLAASHAITAARVAQPPAVAPKSDAVKYVEKFLGPLLCCFGHWVLRKATADGAERLYFASRDTRLLWSTCRILNGANARSIDLRYLLVSRQALLLPSITDASPAGLPWLLRIHAAPTLPRVLARLEMDYADWADDWNRFRPRWSPETPLATTFDLALFWKFLSSPRVRSHVLEAAARRRSHAREFFAHEGLLDDIRAGFVDVGWFLTCQLGLNRLRAMTSTGKPIKGYYLGLKRSRLAPAEAGDASAIFREGADDLPIPRHLAWLLRNYLVEQVVGFAGHATVKCYGEGGSVEFMPGPQTPEASRFGELEAAVESYARVYGGAWAGVADDECQLRQFLGTLLNDFFERPSPDCVRILETIMFTPDPGCENSERLIEPYTWREVLRSLRPTRASADPRERPDWRWWPEASAAFTPPVRRFLHAAPGVFRSIRRGRRKSEL